SWLTSNVGTGSRAGPCAGTLCDRICDRRGRRFVLVNAWRGRGTGMIKFSASEAALEGFRLTRERPGTIFGWGVVYAVCMFLIGQLMLVSLDPELIALTRSKDLEQADIERVSNLLAQSLPAFLLVLVLVVALLSCLMGGIYRLVLRPGEKG